MQACESCKWWRLFDEDETEGTLGVCHRYPPVLVVAPSHTGDEMWAFPDAHKSDYCGEYKRHGS